ncbi:C10 family peptidase [Parabacteroides faecis]|uniref:C10 family peptidase n=1 Tax=Parabacteroides faecis TaxID=1217282 RepID=UPI003521B223
MNYKKYLGLVCLFITAISCNQQDLEEPLIDGVLPKQTIGLTELEYLSIAFDGNNELSETEATDILNDFAAEKSVTKSTTPIFKLTNKTIVHGKNLSTRSSFTNPENDQVVFYEYEIDNFQSKKGKAMVCGDKRFPSVIAYSDSYENIEPAKIMIKNAQEYTLSYISQIRYYKDSLRTATLEKIGKIKNISSNISLKDIENDIFILEHSKTKSWSVNPSGPLVSLVGPLTTTNWNQISPYNLKSKSTIGTNDDSLFGSQYDHRYPAGCVVVAMAQIAAYYKARIPDIDWSLATTSSVFDKTSPAAIQIGELISKIAIGSKTTYGPKGALTNTEDAGNYVYRYGIRMGQPVFCTFQNMKESLDELRLVYITGFSNSGSDDKHAWLADGYQLRQRYSRQLLSEYNVYCHCNFGWGGLCDGWYLFDIKGTISFNLQRPGSDFNRYLLCYPSIYY